MCDRELSSLFPAIGLFVSLFVIVILVVKRIDYGLALLVGSIVLGFLSGLSLQQFASVLVSTLTDLNTYELAAIVALIPILSNLMQRTGMIGTLTAGIRERLSGRGVLTILPALMGVLSMPGGALMSAPLIDEEAEKLGLGGEKKTYINIWFRHWAFFINPLSSALILLSRLSGFGLYTIIAILMLPTVVYLSVGYFVSIRNIDENDNSVTLKPSRRVFTILTGILPIIIVVVLNILGLSMVFALIVGIVATIIMNGLKAGESLAFIKEGLNLKLPFAIFGVMVFRYTIEHSSAISSLLPVINLSGVSTTMVLVAFSSLIGFVTAMPTAGIAIIIPLAVALVQNISVGIIGAIYLTVTYAYIVSPMHLCLILTVGYYKSRLTLVYRRLVPSISVSYVVSLIIILLLSP